MTSISTISATHPPVTILSQRKWHGRARAAGGILFLVALFLPLIGTWRQWDPSGPTHENRVLAARPSLPRNFKQAAAYTDNWMNYFRDHFGFRNTLIRAVALARFRVGESTDPHVLIGKDGWLYYRPDGDRNLIAFRGLRPFTEDDLDAWQRVLEQRYRWLAAHGIPMLLVIPPDKQTIYPEFLPDEFAPLRTPSRLDQLIDRLHSMNSPLRLLDLRPTLLTAKQTTRVYFKTDTHWNDRGAYAAYRAIMPAIQKLLPRRDLVSQPLDNFIARSAPFHGDLMTMADLSDQYSELSVSLTRKVPFILPPTGMNLRGLATTDGGDATLPRLVFYHDSYAFALAPMIGPNFSHIFWSFNTTLDPAAIEREKPDLLIDEFLERDLYLPPPKDPPQIREFNQR
jgi:alginate O-acetyltransferase complex protein AlgJ